MRFPFDGLARSRRPRAFDFFSFSCSPLPPTRDFCKDDQFAFLLWRVSAQPPTPRIRFLFVVNLSSSADSELLQGRSTCVSPLTGQRAAAGPAHLIYFRCHVLLFRRLETFARSINLRFSVGGLARSRRAHAFDLFLFSCSPIPPTRDFCKVGRLAFLLLAG